MAKHYVGAAVTSGAVPHSHTGLNYASATVSLTETASTSTSLAVIRLPAGARVVDCLLRWDNSDLSTTTGAKLLVQTYTNGAVAATLIESADVSTIVKTYSPSQASVGYRHTASSNVHIRLTGEFVGTGTASTAFQFQIVYDCAKTGD